VPKIDTRTVAEHHDLHLSKLLDTALGLVATQDVESLTLAAVAKRAGRSRASLYAYFASTDDLRAAVCAHALESWVRGLLEEIRQESNPADRLNRFIVAQIDHRHHAPSVDRVLAFVTAQQSEPLRTRVRSTTEPLTSELLSIIERLGVHPPTRAATVVQGAVAAAYDQVRAGADPSRVADDTIAFVRAGLDALCQSSSPTDPRHRHAGVDLEIGDVGEADASGRARPAPGALAVAVSPSLPAMFATAVPPTDAERVARPAPARPSRVGAARIAAAQLVWAVVGFVSGATGVGGTGLHVALGVSLVAILAWSVRVLAPYRVASHGLRAMLALALVVSAAALVARRPGLDAALVTHIVLASVLVVGLSWVAGSAWRSHHAMMPTPRST
jgi:AcrR family transcriptional regulator